MPTHLRDFLDGLARRQGLGYENLILLAEVESTNRLARRVAKECLEHTNNVFPVAFLAYQQSAGRGRRGKLWSSPPGAGVYATVAVPLEDPQQIETLPLLAPVGLCRGLEEALGEPRCRLKWPNDLWIEGRKIGGVLVEALTGESGLGVALIGFGINHDRPQNELDELKATSVLHERPDGPNLAELAWTLLLHLHGACEHLGDAEYAAREYRELSLHEEGDVLRWSLDGEVVEGVFRGIDDRGFLLLETPEGERRVSAGEVVER